MNSDLWSCCICCLGYNREDHVPKMIPSCGHTICSSCLSRILETQTNPVCPLDRLEIPTKVYHSSASFPTNILILQLLEEKNKAEYEICSLHGETKNIICLTDKSKLCRSCASSSIHKTHNLKHGNEIKNEAMLKRKQLETLAAEFESYKSIVGIFFEEEHGKLKATVKERFERIINIVQKKEEEILVNIDNFFLQEKSEVEKHIDKDHALKEKMQTKISDLTNMNFNDRFLKTLGWPVRNFSIKPQYEKLRSNAESLEQRFNKMSENFEYSLNGSLGAFQVTKDSQHQQVYTKQEVCENNMIHFQRTKIDCLVNLEERKGWLVISPKKSEPEGGSQKMMIESKFDTLESLKKFKQIKLEMHERVTCKEFVDAFEYIWRYLEDDITSLKLASCADKKFDDQNLLEWCTSYGKFVNFSKLTSFEVNLEECNVAEESISRLFREVLARMKNLKSLDLLFGETKISDKNIGELVSDALVNLEHFNLDVYNTCLTDISIEELFRALSLSSKKFKSLSIGLSNTKITDKSIEAFSRYVIPNLMELEKFKLYLYQSQITDSGIGQVCNSLKEVVGKVKMFTFSLTDTKISDKSVEVFAKNVLPSLGNLEKLELYFDSTQITDVSMKCISNNLLEIANKIKTLTFDLGKTKITDKSMEAVSKMLLPRLSNIENFKLHLDETAVSDSSLKNVFQNLTNRLKTLALSLEKTRVSDKSLDILINQAQPKMLNLKSFDVYVESTNVSLQTKNLLENIQQKLLFK